MSNITVGDNWTGQLGLTTSGFTLSEGPTSHFDMDGSALVIYEMSDDLNDRHFGQ